MEVIAAIRLNRVRRILTGLPDCTSHVVAFVIFAVCLAGLTSCGERDSGNAPHQVRAYLDWRQYKQFSHSDSERISSLRYGSYVAESVAWDSAFVAFIMLIGCRGGGGGGGTSDLPLIFPPVTTEIRLSFCNDEGQVIDSHSVLRGSNTWTETFNDDYVHLYMDISSPLLVKKHIFISTLDLLKTSGTYQLNVAAELTRTRLPSHARHALPVHG